MNKKPLLILALIIIIFAVFKSYIDHKRDSKRLKVESDFKSEAEWKEKKDRYEKGPYIERSADLSDHETAKIIIVPNKIGNFYSHRLDQKCLVYINKETNTSNMVCDDQLYKSNNE